MRKILMDYSGRLFRAALLVDGDLERLMVFDLANQSLIGNIYAGIVKNVIKSGFAFVNIGIGKNAFLQSTSAKQGATVTVMVTKDGIGQKAPKLTENVDLSSMPDIQKRSSYARPPALLHQAFSPLNRVLDEFGEDESIIISNREIEIPHILYQGKLPLFKEYFLEDEIDKLLMSRVWLRSGGFILIEETETCVVVDVNTGKGQKRGYDATILNTNLEAAKELVRQIILRNLSGMIVTDFIPMKKQEDNEALINCLNESLLKDTYKCAVTGRIGSLVRLSRQKKGGSLSSVMQRQRLSQTPLYYSGKLHTELWWLFFNTIYTEAHIAANKDVISAFCENGGKSFFEHLGKVCVFETDNSIQGFEIRKPLKIPL